MTKLKPCPFCGCEMTLQPIYTQPGKTQLYYPVPKGKYSLFAYHKRGCQLENVFFATNAKTRKAAVEKWNRRAEVESLEKQIDALSERVAIMQEGRDGWHFSGTPEIPAGRNQVTVIVWADNGQVYPLNYCRTTIRGKETCRYEWMYWRVYGRDDSIKAWRYLPKAPEVVEG